MKKNPFFAILRYWLGASVRTQFNLLQNLFILLCFFTACKTVTHPVTDSPENYMSAKDHKSNQPNIILIVGDDVGYKALTCNGGQLFETPNLDNMAAQGKRYTQCHASPLCSPSRFALLTGKYNFRNYKKWGNMDPLSNKTIGNMLQDAGYATCYAGKWQLNGYDASILALGWQKYCIWDPGTGQDAGSRYKSPHIYQDGAFLPDNLTLNKYADDMFLDYINNFTDTVAKPYFVCYSMSLVHDPFSPTPDDAEFAGWDPDNPGDVRFFPSMVKYMDKKVGELLSMISSNTVVIYVGDNGMGFGKADSSGRGGKGSCTENGTHVPLIVYKPGKASYVDSSLVDLTDFLPTLASIAKIPLPVTYGILDGTAFYPKPGTRQWIYYHYNPHPNKEEELTVWVQNSVYKKYDTTVTDKFIEKRKKLFNIHLDPDEVNPIRPRYQSSEERMIDSSFKSIIQFYSLQQ